MGTRCSTLPLLLSFTVLSPFCRICQSCYTDTGEILVAQLKGITQIELCAGTTLEIGLPIATGATRATRSRSINHGSAWSAMLPLIIVNDNVHVYCGPDKRSSNKCVVQGGAVQFMTTSYDNPLVVSLLSGLDTSNMTTNSTWVHTHSTNNLHVTGLTFQGQLVTMNDYDRPGFHTAGASVSIGVSGYNIVFDDCIFQNLTSSRSMFVIKRANDTKDAHFRYRSASVTFQNSIFENLQFARRVVENFEQVLTFENVSFTNITYQPWLLSSDVPEQEVDEESLAFIFQLFQGATTFMINVTMKNIETLTAVIFQDASPTVVFVERSTIEYFSIYNQSTRPVGEYCAGGWLYEVEGVRSCDDFIYWTNTISWREDPTEPPV